jgi:CheY-like chemotaxis protein
MGGQHIMTTHSNRPAILLVDDNPHDVVLIRLAFRKVGIIDTIQLVKDGIEAMHYIRGDGIYADRQLFPAPTLMLLDLRMPQTSGFDVLQWVRQQPALDGLLVVVMTGSRDNADLQRAYSLGANSYLVKPSRFSDLVLMMESLKDYCFRPGFWKPVGNESLPGLEGGARLIPRTGPES